MSFNLIACQDSPRGYSDNQLQEILSYAKDAHYADYELTATIFYNDEKDASFLISGPRIPEVFQNINFKKRLFPVSLNLLPLYGNYIKFVETLTLHCDGRIDYIQKGEKFEISREKLFKQGRWRPLHLNMCGRWVIPEGHRLLIYAKNGSHLQDLDLQTSPNSLFSLTFKNVEYHGESPLISAHPLSALMLTFF